MERTKYPTRASPKKKPAQSRQSEKAVKLRAEKIPHGLPDNNGATPPLQLLFVQAINRRLQEKNMTLVDLAEKTDLNYTGLLRWLNGGKESPRMKTLETVLNEVGLVVEIRSAE